MQIHPGRVGAACLAMGFLSLLLWTLPIGTALAFQAFQAWKQAIFAPFLGEYCSFIAAFFVPVVLVLVGRRFSTPKGFRWLQGDRV